jgi:Mn2+/Fe2+ NRAMP family transporter
VSKVLEIVLGIVTSIGGFLDVGAIATAAEAGSSFQFQLIWAIALGTICVIFLVEMSGRLAAVSKHTLADAVRERFGFKFYLLPAVTEGLLPTIPQQDIPQYLFIAVSILGALISPYLFYFYSSGAIAD